MTTFYDDEKLAAYALGELDETERAAVEAHVNEDETARRTVSEFRAAAQLAAEALKETMATALNELQRTRIRKEARRTGLVRQAVSIMRGSLHNRLLWLAASLLVFAGAAAVLFAGRNGPISPFVHLTGGPPQSERNSGGLRNTLALSYAAPAAPPPGSPAAARTQEQLNAMGYLERKGQEHAVTRQTALGKGHVQTYGTVLPPGEGESETPADAGQKTTPVSEKLPTQQEHYLIKTATVSVETDDAQEAAKQLTVAVTTAGGYVSDLHEQTDGFGRHNVQIQVRVPADKLDSAMQGLEALGRVLDRQITTQDVSEEYVDTDARIRNLKSTEERLLDHLKTAILIDSTLKIEQELTRVREQLERLEGRQHFLNNRIQYSTIQVMFTEKPKAGPVVPMQTFSTGNVVSEAIRSLVVFLRGVWVKAIWAAVWLPVWGIGAVAAWLACRRIRKYVRRG